MSLKKNYCMLKMWLRFGCSWLAYSAFVVGGVYNNEVIAQVVMTVMLRDVIFRPVFDVVL